MYYNQYQKNIYSQGGEDGVIEQILKELGIESGYCCEFGAWDGKNLSNTYRLIESGKFKGLMIEGDPDRYRELLQTKNSLPTDHLYTEYTMIPDGATVDRYLAFYHFPEDIDVLSIDIDGNDYQIWKEMIGTNAKIVIIEVNSGFPPDELYSSIFQGTSFTSMLELGNSKGYDCVWHSGNMIFVRRDLVGKLSIPKELLNSPLLFDKFWLKKD